MAWSLTVNEVEIISYVDLRTLSVEETASQDIALLGVMRFEACDATGTLDMDTEHPVVLTEGGTTYFSGKIKQIDDRFEGLTHVFKVQCCDQNMLLEERVIETYTIHLGDMDDAEIAAIFAAYRSDVDATTYVVQLDAYMQGLVLDEMTVRKAMDAICERTGARYYVSPTLYLHYFDTTEANAAAFSLSDDPDEVASFGYRRFKRSRDSTRLAKRFRIVGSGTSVWVEAPDYEEGDPEATIGESWIMLPEMAEDRGSQLLDRFGEGRVTYELETMKDGLSAGMDVTVVNSAYSLDASLTIRKLVWTFADRAGTLRWYHLYLNDELPSATARDEQMAQAIHKLQQVTIGLNEGVFDVNAPATPTLTAGNLTTGVTEDADGHQVVYLQVTWGSVGDADLDHYQVQLSTSSDFSGYTVTRNHPADGDRIERFDVLGNTTYYVRVRAEDWAGNDSAWSDTQSKATATDTTAPGDPSGLSAAATALAVYLTWTANTELDLAHYVIQRAPNAGGSPGTYATVAIAKLNFVIDNSVTPGTSYWYRINATDTSGNASGWVQTDSYVTPSLVTGTYADLELLDWNHSLVFSATDYNTVAWAAGAITMGDDSTTYSIDAGNTGNMGATTYVFLDTDVSATVLQTTTTASAAVGTNRILVAVCKPTVSPKDAEFYVMRGYGTGVMVTADNIVAQTITTDEIAANTIVAGNIAAATITGAKIAANTITAANIAADTITAAEIAASTITAAEINVAQLSAIAADLGTITAGIVTGATIRTAASGARVVLDSTDGLQVYNAVGTLVAQLDVDGSGQLGATGLNPLIWNTAGQLEKINVNQIDVGPGGNNLLVNSAFLFDDDGDGIADDWVAGASATHYSIGLDTGDYIIGSQAQSSSLTSTNPSGVAVWIYQDVTMASAGLLVGDDFAFSAWVKTAFVADCSANVYVAWRNAGGSTVQTDSCRNTAGSVDWARYSTTGTIPATAVVARVYVVIATTDTNGTGSVLVDGIQLERGDLATQWKPGFLGNVRVDATRVQVQDTSGNLVYLGKSGSDFGFWSEDSSGNMLARINAEGVAVSLENGASGSDVHAYAFDLAGAITGGLYGYYTSGLHAVHIMTKNIADRDGLMYLTSSAPSGHEAYVQMAATCAGNTGTFTIRANTNGEYVEAYVDCLVLYSMTPPSSSASDGVELYSEDVDFYAELKVRDEAGNITTLSPHNFTAIPEGPSEPMAWSFHSERDGMIVNVDMLRAMRVLEKVSGEKLVYIKEGNR